ncbi:MAG: aldehyde ferredoxin oxidoreductase family protein [Chloroflexi bacterium]|jgi:aldehyde:ferredoxin oxidoreductase|nr:aldehyde ferredoxin oxidoreductase family protein [Chloroflexota bacterium]
MASFHNKILRVNLTDGTIAVEEPGQVYLRRYMGGWNIIADVLLKEVPKGADPLGPENKLVFAPGVLTGLAISGAARMAVGAKSPLTGGFGAAEVGGYFGSEFKQAGFDALIVEGVSPKPVYLWIKDGQVEIRDASHLWGKTTKETLEALREESDRRAQAAMIGPGGENMVRYACVMDGLKDAAGRTGLGAVMGSKRLKAVVARATNRLEGVNPEKVREMARFEAEQVREGKRSAGMSKWGTGGGDMMDGVLQGNLPIRNFRDGEFPEGDGLSYIMDKIGVQMEGCYACAVRCKKVVKAETPQYSVDPSYGGPEYETLGSLGSTCGVSDVVAVSRANELCNAYSLDTIGAGVTIAFAMECFENGLLTLEDTDGIDLRFGNGDAMIQMVSKIARREGLGNLLAEGLATIAEKIGRGSEMYAMQTKNQAFPMHEPRFKRGLAIGYAVSPTGADHCHSLHDSGMVNATDEGFTTNGRLRGLGVLEPMPLESLGPEKVRAGIYHSTVNVMFNCLPMCMFPGWSVNEMAELVEAATGWDVTTYELMQVGERALNLARVYNMREGFTIDDDRLPERSYGPTIGGALADGGIDREELREAVQTYYGMMGWDEETGKPRRGTLESLDIGWAASYLPQ